MPIVSGVCRIASDFAPFRRGIPTLLLLLQESALLAQGTGTSPWVMAVDELSKTITGPLAKGLSLIAKLEAHGRRAAAQTRQLLSLNVTLDSLADCFGRD